MLSSEGHPDHSYQHQGHHHHQQEQQQQHHQQHHQHHHHHTEGHVLCEGNMHTACLMLFLLMYVTPVLQAKSLASRRSVEAVVPLERVMEQSACKPRETLVSIVAEYPGDTEFRYHPSCVAVMRCSGWCSDEAQECLPTARSNVTLEVFKVNHLRSGGLEQMSFTQHDSCKCGCKPCSGPRLQQDPNTCRCSCRTVCKHKLVLNKHTCKCEKPRR